MNSTGFVQGSSARLPGWTRNIVAVSATVRGCFVVDSHGILGKQALRVSAFRVDDFIISSASEANLPVPVALTWPSLKSSIQTWSSNLSI